MDINDHRLQENEMQEKIDNFKEDNDVIYQYTIEQAIEDGVLVRLPYLKVPYKDEKISVVITTNMMESFRVVCSNGMYTEQVDGEIVLDALNKTIRTGLRMLNETNKEDEPNMRLRVIKPDTYWVIADGSGITFLKPEDR
jgi:type I site-specific restriction endonuclease